MVDSRNFKKQNQKGQGLKKHKWIPLVVIVVLALVLILIQYFMIGLEMYKKQCMLIKTVMEYFIVMVEVYLFG